MTRKPNMEMRNMNFSVAPASPHSLSLLLPQSLKPTRGHCQVLRVSSIELPKQKWSKVSNKQLSSVFGQQKQTRKRKNPKSRATVEDPMEIDLGSADETDSSLFEKMCSAQQAEARVEYRRLKAMLTVVQHQPSSIDGLPVLIKVPSHLRLCHL
jgi:hypothetical protein